MLTHEPMSCFKERHTTQSVGQGQGPSAQEAQVTTLKLLNIKHTLYFAAHHHCGFDVLGPQGVAEDQTR